ncbi:DUF3781 domain-containing protein [uncultured Brachyspira sp.]|uniref:DUF3781 domain-containing protein n=1 Tax=uncultured Brachyspira sp. TaxID=221953 RepID=UPI00263A21B3|nr:DUF3781 domain-containing protein [uncultured Brachyspira sp.]
MEKELLINLEKLHTTKLGIIRIKKNLSLNDCDDVIEWCKKQISQKKTNTFRRGKNLYISFDDFIITVNASSFTIITAHKKRI